MEPLREFVLQQRLCERSPDLKSGMNMAFDGKLLSGVTVLIAVVEAGVHQNPWAAAAPEGRRGTPLHRLLRCGKREGLRLGGPAEEGGDPASGQGAPHGIGLRDAAWCVRGRRRNCPNP